MSVKLILKTVEVNELIKRFIEWLLAIIEDTWR